MGERASVDQHTGKAFFRRLAQPIDELTLVIGLLAIDARAPLLGESLERGMDVTQRLFTVDLGLTGAQELKVGPRKHQNGDLCHYTSCSSSFGAAVRIRKRPLPKLPSGVSVSARKYSSLMIRMSVVIFSD